MLKRALEKRLIALSKQFPATLIVGPRQVGKTTLARMAFPEAVYVDLENPNIRELYEEDMMYQLTRHGDQTVILDEVQVCPRIFSALRSVIDQKRPQKQRFILLGSAQPTLIRGVSESLAGRVGLVELEGLMMQEIGDMDYRTLWLKGGFPDALSGDFRNWWDVYLKMFLERDLGFWGIEIDSILMRKLLIMLAHQQGGILNQSALGRALGMSHHTVARYIHILENTFLIRILHPYFRNIKKRLVKSPKVYIRDTGLLHHLLNIDTIETLETNPIRGASWETFVIEDIIKRLHVDAPFANYYFWRTQAGSEADFVIEKDNKLHLIEVKLGTSIKQVSIRRMQEVMKDVEAKDSYILNQEKGKEAVARGIIRMGFQEEPAWMP